MGLTAVAVTHDLLSGMPLALFIKELIHLWNSILPEPGQPSAKLSKLIHLTACKKPKHTVSRWYRTVCIQRLVASYNMHKGKRWLNSNPPQATGVKTLFIFFFNLHTSFIFMSRLGHAMWSGLGLHTSPLPILMKHCMLNLKCPQTKCSEILDQSMEELKR